MFLYPLPAPASPMDTERKEHTMNPSIDISSVVLHTGRLTLRP